MPESNDLPFFCGVVPALLLEIGVAQDKTAEARGSSGNKLTVLRKHPIFSDLEPEAFDQLFRYAKRFSVKSRYSMAWRGPPTPRPIPIARFSSSTAANFCPSCAASRRWR